MKYDIITIGSVTEDITFRTSKGVLLKRSVGGRQATFLAFAYGTKVRIDGAVSTFGGGAANAAVSFARLGFKVACLAAVASDERGHLATSNLQKHGVSTRFIQIVGKGQTGFSFVLVGPGNEHIIFSNRGANELLHIGREEAQALAQTEAVYLTSLAGRWQLVLKRIFLHLKTPIAWNPGSLQIEAGLDFLAPYLAKTTVLQLNKEEAQRLIISVSKYKRSGASFLNKTKNLLTILKSYGPAIVLITEASQGASAYDGKTFYHQPALRKKNIADTTGVGDAFGSAFVAGLDFYNGNIKKALLLGARNAAAVTQKQGAQNGLLSLAEIKK